MIALVLALAFVAFAFLAVPACVSIAWWVHNARHPVIGQRVTYRRRDPVEYEAPPAQWTYGSSQHPRSRNYVPEWAPKAGER